MVSFGCPRPSPSGRNVPWRGDEGLGLFVAPICGTVGVPSCRRGRTNGRSVTGRRSRGSTKRAAGYLSARRSVARARPAVCAADAAARDRRLLARASAARRSPGAGAGGKAAARRTAGLGGSAARNGGLPATFRTPPAPYRERAYARGPGFCCVCGQPVYRFGWHVDLWDAGPNKNATWHCACVIAWQFWNAPSGEARLASAPAGPALRAERRPACGRPPKSIIACRCSGCGANCATRRGRSCSTTGACRTCR